MKYHLTKVSLACLLCLLIVITGCYINIGWYSVKYQRQVRLSAPFQRGSLFEAQTHNGSIKISGAEVADCNLTATIIACAATDQDAEKLAEGTKIELKSFDNKLTAKIIKPPLATNQSVSVSFDVTIPNQADLDLTTHNGALTITNITGQVDATTHNGRVRASQISGTTKLCTHNGSISCKEIAGDAHLRTHNGGINVVYSDIAVPVFNTSMVTHNGGIDFTGPPNLSAAVEISTHNGSIRTQLPITVTGKIAKTRLKGTIGAGQGKLHLETHNGSIKIR